MRMIRAGNGHFYSGASRDIADLATNVRASASTEAMTPLAPNFSPGSFDVICARGKKAYNHSGNCRFRLMIDMHLEEYSNATSKLEKSLIVSQVVDSVRQSSPEGGFVKEEQGVWYEVGDHIAREKVGQSFRDLLHTKYKSSTKAKKRRRKALLEQLGTEFDGKATATGCEKNVVLVARARARDPRARARSPEASHQQALPAQTETEISGLMDNIALALGSETKAVPARGETLQQDPGISSNMRTMDCDTNAELLQQLRHQQPCEVFSRQRDVDLDTIQFHDPISAQQMPPTQLYHGQPESKYNTQTLQDVQQYHDVSPRYHYTQSTQATQQQRTIPATHQHSMPVENVAIADHPEMQRIYRDYRLAGIQGAEILCSHLPTAQALSRALESDASTFSSEEEDRKPKTKQKVDKV